MNGMLDKLMIKKASLKVADPFLHPYLFDL